MRPVSAVACYAAMALVSGVRWSCQAKSSPACISTHIIYPPRSHSLLGDGALITQPSPSALVIGLLCPAQMKSGPCITAHIVASTCINTYGPLYTHAHAHTHVPTTQPYTSKNLKDNLFFSVSCNSLVGHWHYLNVNAHTHTHTCEKDISMTLDNETVLLCHKNCSLS